MDDTQRTLEKLLSLLYDKKIDVNSLPKNELKKLICSKLSIVQENTGNIAADEFEAILNIFLKNQNEEGIIYLVDFLIMILKKVDSLQEEIRYIETQNRMSMERLLEKYPLEFYSVRYGIQRIYKDTYYSVKNHVFQGKGCIYCVITGNYDQLKRPQFINQELDYICFTDNKELTSDIWNVIQIDNFFDIKGLDKVRIARYIKIVGYQLLGGYDYSIYIDGKIQIIGDMLDYIKKYAKSSSLLCCPHYLYQSLYEEVPDIIDQKLDDIIVVENQIKRYRDEGFPSVYQQIDSTCLVRSHLDKELDEVMKLWWLEVKNGSKRDQLSFTYACWKKRYVYDISDVYTPKNSYFGCTNHK